MIWLFFKRLCSGSREEDSFTCKQCGDAKQNGNEAEKLVDSSFELIGCSRKGQMKYEQTRHYVYTCPRCGTEHAKVSRTHVRY